ncbi:hypothetical protein ACT16_19650 [Mycobacterium heckeshornense]|nr:hypothetical protein ACT16_19650 [Mycobacterium heckeshornense]
MPDMGALTRRVHIRRVQNHRVDRTVLVWKFPAVNTLREVGREEVDVVPLDFFPERSRAVCHVRDRRARTDVQVENLMEQVGVDSKMRRKN